MLIECESTCYSDFIFYFWFYETLCTITKTLLHFITSTGDLCNEITQMFAVVLGNIPYFCDLAVLLSSRHYVYNKVDLRQTIFFFLLFLWQSKVLFKRVTFLRNFSVQSRLG